MRSDHGSAGTPEEWFEMLDAREKALRQFGQTLEQRRKALELEARRALVEEPAELRTRLEAVLPQTPQEARYGLKSLDHLGDMSWVGSEDIVHAQKSENDHANDSEEKPLDKRIEGLCLIYLSATPSQRCIIRALVTHDFRRNILHFAWRMAVRVLRTGSVHPLRLGLASLSIEDQKHEDFRITLTFLVLLQHAASRTGIDASEYFKEIAGMSSSETAKLILSDQFVRPSIEERLKSFGIHVDPKRSKAELERLFHDLGEAMEPAPARIESFGFREGRSPAGPTLDWILKTEGFRKAFDRGNPQR